MANSELKDKLYNNRKKIGIAVVVLLVIIGLFLVFPSEEPPDPQPEPEPVKGELVVDDVVNVDNGESVDNPTITVDGQSIDVGEYVTLDEGEYTVEANSDGYKSSSKTVIVNDGETTTVTIELEEKISYNTAPDCTEHKFDGDGVNDNPYKVSNVYDLQCIQYNPDSHYGLTNDIDASYTSKWNDGSGFDPIGYKKWNNDDGDTLAFTGVIDGNGYTISGLHSRTDDISHDAGLVSWNKGVVKNLKMKNPDINGFSYAGGIVGDNYSEGSVENVAVVGGSVKARDSDVGGIVGVNAGNVNNVYALNTDITIESGTGGGLVGETRDIPPEVGTTTNGYAVVTINGDKTGQIFGSSNNNTKNTYYLNDRYPPLGFGRASDELVGLDKNEMTGTEAQNNMNLNWESEWETTDKYPTLKIFKEE
jgi:hypothetical protein